MGKHLLLALVVISTFVSCDKNRVFDDYKSLNNQWNKDTVVKFTFDQNDSTEVYNLFINLRNTNDYQYSNIYLIAKLDFPNGKVIQDTLQYQMSYPDGRWMGVGSSDSKASKLWYKKNFIFNEKGEYTFSVRQAMRENNEENGIANLKGITEVGFRIEQANNE